MKSIEVSARSKEAAILEGLTILQATYEDVRIEVLVEGGLFSKCKLRMTLLEEKKQSGNIFERLERTRLVESEPIKQEKPKPNFNKPQNNQKNKPKNNQNNNQNNNQKNNQKNNNSTNPVNSTNTQKEKAAEANNKNNNLAKKEPKNNQIPKEEFDGDGFGRINDFDKLREFLQTVLDKMKFDAKVDLVQAEDGAVFNINTQDMGAVIGYRGETLDAMQMLLMQVVHKELADGKKIVVDCQNYRDKRAATLTTLAERMAKKAVQTGKKVRLEPMSSIERRVIHAALTGNVEVSTYSEGNEPNRHLVIVPKNQNRNNHNNNKKSPRPRSNLGGSNFSENAGQPKVSGFEEYHFNKKER